MCIETKYLYLKCHTLFNDMDEAKIAGMLPLVKVHSAGRGQSINYGYGEFSKIYFVVTGKVKVFEASNTGEELIKDILTEGDYFGDLGLSGNPAPDEYAEALTANATLCCFKSGDFRAMLQCNPMTTLQYAGKVSTKLRKLEGRHADLVFKDAKARLIKFIKDWARADGNHVGDSIVLNNYLTHSEIASFICTSRQSVNVLLNELRDCGMLGYDRKKIELRNLLQWN